MAGVSFVPCVCWVPKGAATEVPDKVRLSTAEIQGLLKDAQDHLRGLDLLQDGENCSAATGQEDAVSDTNQEGEREGEPAAVDELYDLKHYDSSGEEDGEQMSGAGNSLAGLTYYACNEEDPYITLKDVSPEDDDEEDNRVLPSDNLLVVGRADEEFSSVEVHVYSESDDHAHSHHEILLTAFPLALEWMDFDPEQPDKKGNYLVVGTMSPHIEVWDMDVIDALEPVFTLGDPSPLSGRRRGDRKDGTKRKKKKKKKKVEEEATNGDGSVEEGHSDAVLGLSWNKRVRAILASASADGTVRLWDMAWPKCVLTIPHPDKVQCLQWHPYEPELLVTGGYDKVVRLYNCKSPESAVQQWKVKGQVERVLWNHFQPDLLLACTDKSTVWCLHKVTGAIVFQIHAHSGTISDLSLSCHVPGLLVTAGTDDTVKFWDVQDNTPVFLLSREMHMGAVFCARFCVDSPYTLAVGGQKNGFHLLNVATLLPVAQRFRDRGLLVLTTPHDGGEELSDSTRQSKMKVSEGEKEVEVAMETEEQTPQEEGRVGAMKLKDQGGGGRGVAMKPIKTVAGRRYNRKRRKQ